MKISATGWKHVAALSLSLVGVVTAAVLTSCKPGDANVSRGSAVADAETRFRLQPIFQVGQENGSNPETFGVVGDVAIRQDGGVYVLDPQGKQVLAFSPSGEFLGVAGRMGRGPGELMVPVAIMVDGRGRLWVADAGNQRLEAFVPGGGEFRHERGFPLDFAPEDVCADGDRLYVLGLRERRVVHEMSADGRVIRSFGAPPGDPRDEMLSRTLAAGLLECAGGAVRYLPAFSPEVRSYEGGAAAFAGTVIPDYNAMRIQTNSDGSITFLPGRGGTHDVASSMVSLGRTRLVQVGTLGPGARSPYDFAEVRSFVLDSVDGRARADRRPLPRLVAARGQWAAGVEQLPYPRVTLYRVVEP